MRAHTGAINAPKAATDWYRALAAYEQPDLRRASWQLLNTFVPYAALWILLVWMVRHDISPWWIAPVLLVAAGLLVRIFIIFHDCCHDSFFASRRANQLLGYVAGILTFTAFEDWRRSHARHHATAGDLDRRGTGDIWTLTVAEYQAAPWRTRLAYRLVRNPFVLLVLLPPLLFFLAQRVPHKGAGKRERFSVLLTDLALLAIIGVASVTIGLRVYLVLQLAVMWIAGSCGIWLFYVQHQFEGVYWARHQDWDYFRAAMEGSSYYQLPKVLQWFSGNIGLHYIHHLRPRIPNYNLQRCYDTIPILQTVAPLTLRRSLRSLSLNLWDEANHKLVSFRSLSHPQPQRAVPR
jgi:omega-6 fatty acid desaturase (delta-12 desaturase)